MTEIKRTFFIKTGLTKEAATKHIEDLISKYRSKTKPSASNMNEKCDLRDLEDFWFTTT